MPGFFLTLSLPFSCVVLASFIYFICNSFIFFFIHSSMWNWCWWKDDKCPPLPHRCTLQLGATLVLATRKKEAPFNPASDPTRNIGLTTSQSLLDGEEKYRKNNIYICIYHEIDR